MHVSENPELVAQVREAYKELGKGMYFDIAKRGHAVLYEVPGDRLNWMWCALLIARHPPAFSPF